MDGCNCPIITREELRALLDSEEAEKKEQAIACLVDLLTSQDERMRARGYELFREGINNALFCSCFNYSGLVGGFTNPLLEVVAQSIEIWAAARRAPEPKPTLCVLSAQP